MNGFILQTTTSYLIFVVIKFFFWIFRYWSTFKWSAHWTIFYIFNLFLLSSANFLSSSSKYTFLNKNLIGKSLDCFSSPIDHCIHKIYSFIFLQILWEREKKRTNKLSFGWSTNPFRFLVINTKNHSNQILTTIFLKSKIQFVQMADT